MSPRVRAAWERAHRHNFDDESTTALVHEQDEDFERRGISLGTREGLLERATVRASAATARWRAGDYWTSAVHGGAGVTESLGIGSGLLGDTEASTAMRMGGTLLGGWVFKRASRALGSWVRGKPNIVPPIAKPRPRAPAPTSIENSYDGGWRATWAGDSRALIAVEPDGSGVIVTDVFRGSNPPGTAGQMLADVLRHPRVGIARPTSMRVTKIIHEPTVHGLAQGAAPRETVIGRLMETSVRELGGRPRGWATGTYRDKPWIEMKIDYD